MPLNRRSVLLTFAASAGLAACGSPQGSGGYQIPEPQPGQGLIVLYRPSAAVGGALRFPLTLNSASIGGLANGTVMTQSVGPGQYTVQTRAPSVDGTSSVSLDLAAGQTVYVRGNAILGYPTYRPQLVVISSTQAQSEIAAM